MRVTVGAATDVGHARERNEDSYLAMPPVYIVADGMGGHRGGNVASSLAMEVMSDLASGGDWRRLAEQVRQANHAILERSRGDRSLQGMGTTITATYVDGDEVHFAHVGDSRAYLLRGGTFSQITTDHTLVHEMVKRNQITEAEAEHHPQRSILTRALGVDDGVEVDEFPVQVQPGDRIVLCSDGLHSMVDDDVIQQVLQQEPDPQRAAERLVELANEAGGLDNITVVVMDYAEGDGFAGAAWQPQTSQRGGTREMPVPPGAAEPEQAPDATGTYQTTAGVVGGAAATGAAQPAPAMPGSPPGASQATYQPAPGGRPSTGSEPAPGYQAGPPYQAAPAYGQPTAPEEPGRHRGERRGRRMLLWTVGVIVLLAVALVGLRLYLDTRYFVGVEDGRITVFRGLPTKTLGVKMFGRVESTNIPADRAEALAQWRQPLHDGATAGSLAGAEAIVRQIRSDVSGLQKSGGGKSGSGPSSGGSPSASPT
ncbi:MAG: Stp1/IreP family PP2C-type Ser/Thr phosphatase [Actinomycetota bacterium]